MALLPKYSFLTGQSSDLAPVQTKSQLHRLAERAKALFKPGVLNSGLESDQTENLKIQRSDRGAVDVSRVSPGAAHWRRTFDVQLGGLYLVSVHAKASSDAFVAVWNEHGEIIPEFSTPLQGTQRFEKTDILIQSADSSRLQVGFTVPSTNPATHVRVEIEKISVTPIQPLGLEADAEVLNKSTLAVGHFQTNKNAIYTIHILFRDDGIPPNTVYLEGIDTSTKKRVFKRFLSPQANVTSVVFDSESTTSIFMRLARQNGHALPDCRVSLLAVSIRREHDPMPSITAPYLQKKDALLSVSIATYPLRKDIIGQTLLSLRDRCDVIRIYLNNYANIPEEIGDALSGYKSEILVDEYSRKRAAAKFHWSYEAGYHIICDDDIIYPANYVEKMVRAIERHKKSAVVGVHGVIYAEEIEDSKNSRKHVYDARAALSAEKAVHLLGTGTVAFHSSTMLGVPMKDIERMPYSIDEGFCVIGKRHKKPFIAVDRPESWLKVNPRMKYGLHEEKMQGPHRRREITALLQEHQPWTTPSA